jgi:glycosyltransferase involved in cell wall biosynthesis
VAERRVNNARATPSNPRVLFVTHNFPRFAADAAGSFVLRLASALQHAGAHVQVLAPGAPCLAERDVVEGVSVHRVRYAREDRQTLAYEGTMAEAVRGSWSGRFAMLGLLWHMQRATRRALVAAHRAGTPFDVVHAHWWFPAGLIAWQAGVGTTGKPPLVITLHGSDVRLARSVSPAHPIMRAVLHRARAVTAVSEWLAHEASIIAPRTSIQVAPMPVDVARFAPRMTDAESASTRVGDAEATARARLLFVGRLNAQKGCLDLIEALARTATDIGCDVVGDGPDRAALEERARTLGVSSRVRWLGMLASDALAPLYQDALATVMPSREEGLGLVAVESQLCGTPVIAYASGGLPDVVDPGAGGTLVPAGDVAALARAIDERALAPEESEVMGARARAWLLERFSPDRAAARYLALYAGQPGVMA